MAGQSKTTTDPDEIRRWAEERGGRPSTVKRTSGEDDAGILRIDFPGYSGETSLEEITWEEFFEKFEEKNLAFLYQDETKDGQQSRFFKLVNRQAGGGARDESGRRGAGKAAPKRGGKKATTRKSGSASASRSAGSKAGSAKKGSKASGGKGGAKKGSSKASSRSSSKKTTSPRGSSKKAGSSKGGTKKSSSAKRGTKKGSSRK